MPITFYNECEALQIPSGSNGADGLSAVSQVKDFPTTIPQIDPSNLYTSGSLYASAVGEYGYEWLKVGVFFTLPSYGVYEVVQESTTTATEKLIFYKNRGASINASQGTSVPAGTLIVPAGPPGGNGTNGATVLSGTSNPTTQGNNGDFFINTATSTIFGPKNVTWPTGVSLIGTTGSTGPAGGALLSRGAGSTFTTIANGAFQKLFGSALNFSAGSLASYDKAVISLNWFASTKKTTTSSQPITDTINFTINAITPSATFDLCLPQTGVSFPNNGSYFSTPQVNRNDISATNYEGSYCNLTIELVFNPTSIVLAFVRFNSFSTGNLEVNRVASYVNIPLTKATEALNIEVYASPNMFGGLGQGRITNPTFDISLSKLI
jgi:hypothetical protein